MRSQLRSRSWVPDALAVALDVTDRAAVDKMVKAAVAKFGVVDFLFNSAGAAGRRPSVPGDRSGALGTDIRAEFLRRFQLHATSAASHVEP